MSWGGLAARPLPCSVATAGHDALRPWRPFLPLAVHRTQDLVAAGRVDGLALAGLPPKCRGDTLHPVACGDPGVQPEATCLAAVGPDPPVAPNAVPWAPSSATLDHLLERNCRIAWLTSIDLGVHLPGPGLVAASPTSD